VIPARESPMRELTAKELDEVSGGLFDFANVVVQPSIAIALGFNILSVDSTVAQAIEQANFSLI
jgi:bacteriocin-like protein